MYLLTIIAFYRDQPNWEKSSEEKDTEVEKKMINFNVTDADRNEFGEKYILQRIKSDIGILHLPIIIGVYSAFCNFLAQSGYDYYNYEIIYYQSGAIMKLSNQIVNQKLSHTQLHKVISLNTIYKR